MVKVDSDFSGSALYALHRLSRNEIWCGVLLHFPVDFAGRMMGILFNRWWFPCLCTVLH